VRGGAGGELSVLHAALDTLGEAHQRGYAEVDGGCEWIVALSFRKCLAIKGDGVLGARLNSGEMGDDRCALVARRS